MNIGDITYCTLQDAAQAEQLRKVFREVFEEDGVSDRHLSVSSEFMVHPGVCMIGAMHQGTVVGGLVAYELLLMNGTREMYLYDIAVLSAYQKQGIGTGLIAALKAEAKRRKISTIFVEAEAEDEGAVAFYRSCAGEEVPVRHFNFYI